MSDGNRNTKEDEIGSPNDSDDSWIDVEIDVEIDLENVSNFNELQNLLGFVASGTAVEIGDMLVIEHLLDNIYGRNSDEILTPPEIQINQDEENSGPLEYTHFNSSDLIQEEDLQNLDARSISQNSENYRSSLGTFNKKGDDPQCMENTVDAGNKMSKIPQEEISSTDEHTQTSKVIENPCTQIFKFMHPNLDNLREKSFLRNNEGGLLKCPEYESDEFADVEDNSKESLDYKDLPNDAMALMKQGREMDKQASESMERTTTVLPARSEADSLNDKNVPSTSRTQSYNIDASCSHDRDPKHVPDLPVPAKSEESKLNLKMPTIDEVSELNGKINPKDNTSSRPNPLKMKAKVGRKDKCNVCRARLGLCAIRCRCGGYYCAKHRYDKEHNCTFDYKSMGAEEIRKNNPRVIAEKVRKL